MPFRGMEFLLKGGKEMLNKRFFILGLALLMVISYASSPVNSEIKPFRVIVVIGDQWKDPMNYMVTKSSGAEYERNIISTKYESTEFSGYSRTPEVPEPTDFYNLMILLKSWGIPFDVVRLDQQFLDRNMFLGPDGKPIYGTIIWDVNESKKLLHPDYNIVKDMVMNYGIGLIALSDRIQPSEIQSILGLKYIGSWMSNTELNIARQHFLTKGLKRPLDYTDGETAYKQRVQVELRKGTIALVRQGPYPQVTVRSFPSGARVVWIGSDYNAMFSYQAIRTLLRRAITWTIGYNLYKTWDNNVIMIMDDMGGIGQCSWLEHWHYPTLSVDTIEHYLIKPLQAHKAVLNLNVVPGFANDKKRWVEPTFKQKFVDEYGTEQNSISTKRGIDKGLKAGVFEIMCHGLSHMQPDLTGWWGSKLDQERAEVGWYREFGDTRRGKEIPAAEQLWRMKTANSWLEFQFGVTPLEFCAGGGGSSLSYPNNTYRLAGRAGFGWYGWDSGYLGQDMVIVGWDFFGTHDAPLFVGAPPNGHDFGITTDPKEFVTIFEKYPKAHFIGINEFIGYLHANNSGELTKGEKLELRLTVKYDDHYCQHFKDHSSKWTFELSDWLAKSMGKELKVKVDGKELPGKEIPKEPFDISIPAGVGEHYIEIR